MYLTLDDLAKESGSVDIHEFGLKTKGLIDSITIANKHKEKFFWLDIDPGFLIGDSNILNFDKFSNSIKQLPLRPFDAIFIRSSSDVERPGKNNTYIEAFKGDESIKKIYEAAVKLKSEVGPIIIQQAGNSSVIHNEFQRDPGRFLGVNDVGILATNNFYYEPGTKKIDAAVGLTSYLVNGIHPRLMISMTPGVLGERIVDTGFDYKDSRFYISQTQINAFDIFENKAVVTSNELSTSRYNGNPIPDPLDGSINPTFKLISLFEKELDYDFEIEGSWVTHPGTNEEFRFHLFQLTNLGKLPDENLKLSKDKDIVFSCSSMLSTYFEGDIYFKSGQHDISHLFKPGVESLVVSDSFQDYQNFVHLFDSTSAKEKGYKTTMGSSHMKNAIFIETLERREKGQNIISGDDEIPYKLLHENPCKVVNPSYGGVFVLPNAVLESAGGRMQIYLK